MTVDIFERYGLRRIVNVSGTETPYGASPVRPLLETPMRLAVRALFAALALLGEWAERGPRASTGVAQGSP